MSGLNPEFVLVIMIQFVAAFYTTEQIHFRFQKSRKQSVFLLLLKDAKNLREYSALSDGFVYVV